MKSLKQNYDQHLVLTLIVLVALPILLGSTTFILINDFYRNQIITFFFQNFNDAQIGIQFLSSFRLLQYVIFVIMLLFYPLYPSIFSLENHLNKRNPQSAITEYQALKKILYALLPLFFFAVALRVSSGITQDNSLTQAVLSLIEPVRSLFLSILASIIFVVASALLRIMILNGNKNFKFYLAKLSLRAMSRAEDDVEKMKYLLSGLTFYNKYVRRAFGLQINDLKAIYSKIITDNAVIENQTMRELSLAFENNQKLRPIKYMTALLHVNDAEHFLVKESIGKQLEAWISIIGALASSIVAVIGAVVTLFAPAPT